ncbi:MAG: hypothetical protein WBA93_05630 [Microcoleaceae cyanobacterium]
MLKIIYDLIQRFEVENGVPRLVSTQIEVIEGGKDLMSLAISLLKQFGFYEQFNENRTSQYIGYRVKNPGKGAKRYQLVLSPRQEGLCISIPQDLLKPHILELRWNSLVSSKTFTLDRGTGSREEYKMILLGLFWILPSKKQIFLDTVKQKEITAIYQMGTQQELQGLFCLNYYHDIPSLEKYPRDFSKHNLADKDTYIILDEDKLFPYTWQTCINSGEVLEEYLSYFVKIIMEQN